MEDIKQHIRTLLQAEAFQVTLQQGMSQEKLEAIRATKTGGETKRLVMENEYIDVDLEKLNKEIKDHSKTKYQKSELAKARAVLYRFYNHVRLEGDQYVCSLKSADEINISHKFFKYLMDGQKNGNEDIKKMKAKAPNMELPQITPEYLQALLQ